MLLLPTAKQCSETIQVLRSGAVSHILPVLRRSLAQEQVASDAFPAQHAASRPGHCIDAERYRCRVHRREINKNDGNKRGKNGWRGGSNRRRMSPGRSKASRSSCPPRGFPSPHHVQSSFHPLTLLVVLDDIDDDRLRAFTFTN